VEDYAFAQEREAGAAVHLSFDHLDFVDVAFHGGGAVGQGQAGGDGLLVAADAVGEGVQVGLVVGFYLGESVFEGKQALAVCHHLREAADVAGQRVQVRAAGRDGSEPGLVISVEAAGAG
jgi:NAD(P)H-hydrate repair Nnr-like enzyme with NAD(P)H-hydrate epimerase domain